MLSEICLANKNESEQTNMRLFKNNTINVKNLTQSILILYKKKKLNAKFV